MLLESHRWVQTLTADQSAIPVLVSMGIVKLSGISRPWHSSDVVPVTFDPVATALCNSKQRLYVPGNVPESAVSDRVQKPPTAILRVLGTIEPPCPTQTVPMPGSPSHRGDISVSGSPGRRSVVFSPEGRLTQRPTGYEDIFSSDDYDVQITTLLDDCKASSHAVRKMFFTDFSESNDEGVTNFSDSQVAEILSADSEALHQSLKQYLTSAIVSVAASTKALVVAPGTGNLSRLLGRGADIRRTAIEGDSVQILGISAKCSENDAACTTTIPHHIVLVAKQDHEYRAADSTEVQQFVKKLCTEAASGLVSRHFTRPKVGVVYILFGGVQADCQSELLHAVKSSWPIFLVENSGGLAEHLVSVLRRIEAICGNPTIDDYRSILASHDPVIAEILINGDLHIVDLGTPVNDFARAVELSIHQDETLQQAWFMYATWNQGTNYYYWLMTVFQVVVSILGIMTTAGSIIQCLFQLQFPALTDQKGQPVTTQSSPISTYYATMSILLIILPILTSLVQAVMYQVNPAQQWVALRRASQFLLREIYLYRTCTRKYSIGSVVRSRRKDGDLDEEEEEAVDRAPDNAPAAEDDADGNADEETNADAVVAIGEGAEPSSALEDENAVDPVGGGTVAGALPAAVDPLDTDEGVDKLLDTWHEKEDSYSTRQQLLHKRMSSLRDELAEIIRDGLLRTDEVVQYPPAEILESGDDGFSKMSPQQYVDCRLKRAIAAYIASSNALRREFLVMTYTSSFLGTIGTFLAAVSLYQGIRSYNVQFWVSLTTSLQTWISRYLEYTRVEHLLKEHCKAKDHLSTVEHWWTQLQQPGIASDSQVNRNKLVGKVEAHITHEVEETSSQLRNLADRMQQALETKDSEGQQAPKADDQIVKEEVAKLNKIGVQLLQADNIQAALADRTGNAAVQIHQALERVTELLVNRPMEDDVLEAGLKKQREFEQMFAGDFIALNGLVLGTKMPVMVEHLLADRTLKNSFSEVFKGLSTMQSTSLLGQTDTSRLGLLNIVKSTRKELWTAVAQLPHRRFLNVMRSLLEDLALNRFEEAIKSLDLSLYDLVSMRADAEVVMAELGYIASQPWKDKKLSELVESIQDDDLKAKVKVFGEAKLRAVLKRAESFFTDSAGPPIVMLNAVVHKIAQLDVSELYCDVLTIAMRCALCDKIFRGIEHIPRPKKKKILALLPPCARCRPEVVSQSTTQLLMYLEHTVYNFFELNVMQAVALTAAPESVDTFRVSVGGEDDQLGVDNEDHMENDDDKQLPGCLKSSEGLVRFFYCVEGVSLDSTKWNKAALLRSFSTGPFYSVNLAADFKAITFEKIAKLAVITRSTLRLTYEYIIFSRIHCGVSGVNLGLRMQTARVISMFIAQIEEFRGLDLKREESTTDELLRRWAAPEVIQALSDLPYESLKELVHSSLLESTVSLPMFLFADVARRMKPKLLDRMVISLWTPVQCYRALHAWRMATVKADSSTNLDRVLSKAVVDFETAKKVCKVVVGAGTEKMEFVTTLLQRSNSFTLVDIFTGVNRKLEKEEASVRQRFLDLLVYHERAHDFRRALVDFTLILTADLNNQSCLSPLWIVESEKTVALIKQSFETKFKFGDFSEVWEAYRFDVVPGSLIVGLVKYISEEVVANGFQVLFQEICSQCISEDLAAHFPSYYHRLLFLFLCMDSMYAITTTPDPIVPSSVTKISMNAASRKPRHTVITTPSTSFQPRGSVPKRSDVKKEMVEHALSDPCYGPIGSTVISLTDATASAVIDALNKENEKSSLVWNLHSLRRRYSEANASELISVDTHLLVAAHFLHHRIQHNATKTKGLLWNFDFNVFVGMAIEEKRKSLEQLIQEDTTVDVICGLEPELAKDFFLRLKPVRKALLSYACMTLGSILPPQSDT